jgi:phospho-N-acetylmuramoyl-pentapeptide-transferase
MLYYLHNLTELYSPLRLFQYITFRAFAAAGTAFLISLLLGPLVIRRLRRMKIGQNIRTDIKDLHSGKKGTPTMGGVLIILAVLLTTLLWFDWSNTFVWMALSTMIYLGAVGFLDDYLKLRGAQRNADGGLSARAKFALQVVWAVALTLWLWSDPATRELADCIMVPFKKTPLLAGLPIGASILFIIMVVVGSSNAVNLTDGLDGLAIGCTNSVILSYLILSYIAGHAVFAEYLQVPNVQGAGELTVFCGSMLGAGLGFLWFNCHPARVFMGDTGSLALGGSIAVVAILIMQELLLLIVGGVFVIEALSVITQVGYFKYSRRRYGQGRRVFRRAPIHHHFELLEKENAKREQRDEEVVETMITIRFWIISIIFALIGVATLKIR